MSGSCPLRVWFVFGFVFVCEFAFGFVSGSVFDSRLIRVASYLGSWCFVFIISSIS